MTDRASTSPNVPIKWSRGFYKYALEANYFARSGLIGQSANSCIRVHTDLDVPVGKTVRMPMIGPLTGVGGGDNFNSLDILESYDIFHFDVSVYERGHATDVAGPYAKQMMIEDWPRTATEAIASWKGRTAELEIIKAICGLYNLSTGVSSVNEHAPSTSRIAYGGETSAGVIGTDSALGDGTKIGVLGDTAITDDYILSAETATNFLMGPNFLEEIVDYWINQEPRPQPLMIENQECYILLMTTSQAKSFRRNTTYLNRNYYAEVRGHKNPLLSTSLGFWPCNGARILLVPYGRMEYRTGAGGTTPQEAFELNTTRTAAATTKQVQTGKTVGRAVLLGAQAGGIAYGSIDGKQFSRFDGDRDSGTNRKPFKGVDWIYGVSKTVFQDEADTAQPDFATMVIDTLQV